MRVAIDGRLLGYLQGGTSRYVVNLLTALMALEDDVEVELLESRKASPQQEWPPGLLRRRLLTPPHHRFEQLTLPLELLPHRIDLLHSPDFIPPFRRRCRSVITVHDLAFLRYPHLLTRESARYYGQVAKAVQSVDRILAVSEATKHDLLELLDADPRKVDVVYEAADPACRHLDPAAVDQQRAVLGLPPRFVLFVGTLEPRKNIPFLLKAFASIPREQRAPLVVVGGKGWLWEEIFQTRDALGLGEEVRFVGQVASDPLVYYYNAAACLVIPSLYEGFGLPVLEAMACGTPVIVSNVSSLPEVAGDAALAVDPSDVEGLAKAIVSVLSDHQLRDALVARGLKRAASFSWDRAARETFAVYRKAVA